MLIKMPPRVVVKNSATARDLRSRGLSILVDEVCENGSALSSLVRRRERDHAGSSFGSEVHSVALATGNVVLSVTFSPNGKPLAAGEGAVESASTLLPDMATNCASQRICTLYGPWITSPRLDAYRGTEGSSTAGGRQTA